MGLVSTLAILWALLPHDGPDAVLRTLTVLADYGDPEGRHAFPLVRTLAARRGCSERTVQRHLAELVELGLIVAGDQRHVAHYPVNKRPTVWDLVLSAGPSDLGWPVDNPDSGGDTVIHRGDKKPDLGVTPVVGITKNLTNNLKPRLVGPSPKRPVDNRPAPCEHDEPKGAAYCALCRAARRHRATPPTFAPYPEGHAS